MVEQICHRKCFVIKFCPLVVAFARTVHSFQGHEAGPGKSIESLIVNPGNRSFEALNPGTLYCYVTRATTLGLPGMHNSSLYFIGDEISTCRIQNLMFDKDGRKYQKVKMREICTSYLKDRRKITMSMVGDFQRTEYIKIIEIINQASMSLQDIDYIIEYHIKNG